VKGDDVLCLVKNSAKLVGTMYTLHAAEIRIDLPTLTDKDKEVGSLISCLLCPLRLIASN